MKIMESLKTKIAYNFERKRGFTEEWTHKGKVADYAKTLGYSSENAGRRLRELVNEGLLERRVVKGKVWYRWRKQTGEQAEIFARQVL